MSDALRFNAGKPPLSYLLTFGAALRAVANVCRYGAQKYAAYNYLRGAPLSQYVDCLMRHLTAWYEGEDYDGESGESHLSHAAWNALCLLEMSIRQPERDDRPNTVMARQDLEDALS